MNIITPGHFLVTSSLLNKAQPDSIHTSLVDRLKHLNSIVHKFWRTWRANYLTQLQKRTKWKRSVDSNLKIGYIVVVRDENTPPV